MGNSQGKPVDLDGEGKTIDTLLFAVMANSRLEFHVSVFDAKLRC